jgi:hypothetical protein
MNATLYDLCKALKFDLGHGLTFSSQSFYDKYMCAPLWNGTEPTSYVIGLKFANGGELKYPFTTEQFLSLTAKQTA